MSILRNLFGLGSTDDDKHSIRHYRIAHGHRAYVQAHQAGLWQITECGVSVCSIELDPPSAPTDDTQTQDLVVSVRVKCRRHGTHQSFDSEPMFAASQSSCSFDLPCGCCSKYDIAFTQGQQLFVWSYDELSVEGVREEPAIARNLAFSACPNCSKSIEIGNGKALDIFQCLGCGTRYCYNCWQRDYITVSCPHCGSTRSIEVGTVGSERPAGISPEASEAWAMHPREQARESQGEGSQAAARH